MFKPIIFSLFSELNVASVDPDLFVLLARNVAKTVQLYVSKCEQLVSSFVFSNLPLLVFQA